MDPLGRAPDTERPPALTRREVLRHGAVLGAAVWAAPAIARLPAAAGAAGSPPVHCGTGDAAASGGEVLASPFEVDRPGEGVFVVPAGVTRVTVEVWGAGGDGSPTPGAGGQGSGGGGGGGWARSVIDVGACSAYTFWVGSAGGGTQAGTTWFRGDRGQEVRATGGESGWDRDGGAGGTGVGENTASGGAGGDGGGNGGGGGGASGGPPGSGASGSDGRDGAGNVGGTGGIALEGQGGGGNGGNRRQGGVDGEEGPGGGGGGTGRNGSPNGKGADGKLVITWFT